MSEKIKDQKNRWRNRTVGFRVSNQEWEQFEKKVKLCGYQKKQDYIMECLMCHKIVAQGNPLMLTQFRKELREIRDELRRIDSISEVDEEFFTPIYTMLEILEAFKANEGQK